MWFHVYHCIAINIVRSNRHNNSYSDFTNYTFKKQVFFLDNMLKLALLIHGTYNVGLAQAHNR